jgi:hypothetical protein
MPHGIIQDVEALLGQPLSEAAKQQLELSLINAATFGVSLAERMACSSAELAEQVARVTQSTVINALISAD